MARFAILLLILSWRVNVQADAVALVPVGPGWRWLAGTREASNPPEAWRHLAFSDNSWTSGSSGFSMTAYYGEATFIPGAASFSTVYLRRSFELLDPDSVRWLVLRIDYSGGFVAYLNGDEIARRGLPGEPGTTVPCNTLAENHLRGVPEEIDLSAFTTKLRAGTNLLAIQWHLPQLSYYSGALLVELRGNFTRGPMLQASSSRTQSILWTTPVGSDTTVAYGETVALGQRMHDPQVVTRHVAVLTDLSPGTRYYYRAESSAGEGTACSPIYSFRTFAEGGPTRFLVMGDVGSGLTPQYNIAGVLRAQETDFVLINGDVIYPTFTAARTDFRCFSVYGEHLHSTPYFTSAGNHEINLGVPADYYAAFHLPTNDVPAADHAAECTTPESYYSFDDGEAHLVVLHVPLMELESELKAGSAQVRWLEADLAATTKPWRILFQHHPVITSNSHYYDDYNGNGIPDPDDLAAVLLPIARRYGVQVIVGAHDHVYERFAPMGGVFAVTSGGGGGTLYNLTALQPGSVQFWARYHAVKVSLDADELHLEALDDRGQVFDTMHVCRTAPRAKESLATWHTPVVETGIPDDGDGNIAGQSFDFEGQPVPTVFGQRSNLGRLWVNQDHCHLYLGIEQTMLYPDQNLFLFLQLPRVEGVTSMTGVGNGLRDPDGEGVDGLDVLENLSFTNFSPGIAAVLGDEYADGIRRSFLRTNHGVGSSWQTVQIRTNLALDIGQGVFWLHAGLPDVTGARIQQYNRSPQLIPFAGEQTANYIEIALPLDVLRLQPGDRIQVGAVVGNPTTGANGVRELDSAFLGAALHGSGCGPVQLEGLTVVLGPDLDADGDGLLAAEEAALGTNPGNPDTDTDGMPDGWEVQVGLSPVSASGPDGPDDDPDSDGSRNWEEWQAGTLPHDPSSFLELDAGANPPAQVVFSWWAVPGIQYRIERAGALGASFLPLPDAEWAPVSNSTRVSHPIALGAAPEEAGFFRLIAERTQSSACSGTRAKEETVILHPGHETRTGPTRSGTPPPAHGVGPVHGAVPP